MYGFDELAKLTGDANTPPIVKDIAAAVVNPVSAVSAGVRRIKEAPGDIANAFRGGLNQVQQGVGKIQRPQSTLGGTVSGLEGGLQIGSGIASMATSPLAPLAKPISEIVRAGTNKIADIPAVQKFAASNAGQTTARVAESLANAGNISGTILGVNKLAKSLPKMPAAAPSKLAVRFGPKGDTLNTLDMYDKYSKSGDMQVYSDPVNKVFRPEIAKRIIENTQTSFGVDKIPNAQYLAQKFADSLDVNRMTPADVIRVGLELSKLK